MALQGIAEGRFSMQSHCRRVADVAAQEGHCNGRFAGLQSLRDRPVVRAHGLHVALVDQLVEDVVERPLRHVRTRAAPFRLGGTDRGLEGLAEYGQDLASLIESFAEGNTSEARRITQPCPSGAGMILSSSFSNGAALRCLEHSTWITSSTGVSEIMASAAPRMALWPRSRVPLVLV